MKILTLENTTDEQINSLWDKVRALPYTYDDRLKDRADIFALSWVNPSNLYIQMEEYGICFVYGINPYGDANVHYATWGEVEPIVFFREAKRIIQYLFKTFKLHRITAYVPENNTLAQGMAKLLGFQREGRMREAYLKDGKFQDTIFYGLLETEYIKEEE